jgi:hypothetical protein
VDATLMVEGAIGGCGAERRTEARCCTPDDIAEVVVFLGFGSAMVIGQTIVVDGGLTLKLDTPSRNSVNSDICQT